MHRSLFRWFFPLICSCALRLAGAAPEAIVLMLGDQHSAYERTAQLVALVDRIHAENPGVPLAILLDGDCFELGNVLAQRSAGRIDYAMFTALARRAPTILNLGNHEPEFADLAETVAKLRATGVTVISNIVNRATGELFAPPRTTLRLGAQEAVVVGVTTDRLNTYRAAVRPTLDLTQPAVWAEQKFPELLRGAELPIVMSHAGIAADKQILRWVPEGALFVGAHDHTRFVHTAGRTVYVHSGSWNEFVSVARLQPESATAAGPRWQIEQLAVDPAGPRDPQLAEIIRETAEALLTPADRGVIARAAVGRGTAEASRFVAAAVMVAAEADAAFIGNTTFGGGLPAGEITPLIFDACVRFDGPIYVAEIDGERLRALLAAANQGVDTPFEQRHGDFLAAAGPATIEPTRRYRIATTDWGARNTQAYFGPAPIEWRETTGLRLKAIARAALVGAQ